MPSRDGHACETEAELLYFGVAHIDPVIQRPNERLDLYTVVGMKLIGRLVARMGYYAP